MAVLILGNAADEHARHIHQQIQGRGDDAILFDTASFPASTSVSFDPESGDGSLWIENGRELKLSEIGSVYWRNYNGVASAQAGVMNSYDSYVAHNDSRSIIESLLEYLPARWVNGWQGFSLHQRKPLALAKVAALGVRIPRTLISNRIETLESFRRDTKDCIVKPVQGGVHTRPVTSTHIDPQRIQGLSIAPVTFQEMIKGTNVRVFVAGNKVLAAEINSKELDFRDDPTPLIKPFSLPDYMAQQAKKIAATLSLLWTGMDFRVTEEGEFVFLEANPSPMFLGFESRSGLPLTEMLVDALMPGRVGR